MSLLSCPKSRQSVGRSMRALGIQHARNSCYLALSDAGGMGWSLRRGMPTCNFTPAELAERIQNIEIIIIRLSKGGELKKGGVKERLSDARFSSCSPFHALARRIVSYFSETRNISPLTGDGQLRI